MWLDSFERLHNRPGYTQARIADLQDQARGRRLKRDTTTRRTAAGRPLAAANVSSRPEDHPPPDGPDPAGPPR